MDESADASGPAPGAGCGCTADESDAWAVALGGGDTVSAEPREAEARCTAACCSTRMRPMSCDLSIAASRTRFEASNSSEPRGTLASKPQCSHTGPRNTAKQDGHSEVSVSASRRGGHIDGSVFTEVPPRNDRGTTVAETRPPRPPPLR